MVSRIATLLAAVALAATAVTAMPVGGSNNNYCTNGSVQCCNQVKNVEEIDVTSCRILGTLGVAVEELTGEIGLGCTAVDVYGVGAGQECTQSQVCCTGNNFDGVAVIGCTPLGVST